MFRGSNRISASAQAPEDHSAQYEYSYKTRRGEKRACSPEGGNAMGACSLLDSPVLDYLDSLRVKNRGWQLKKRVPGKGLGLRVKQQFENLFIASAQRMAYYFHRRQYEESQRTGRLSTTHTLLSNLSSMLHKICYHTFERFLVPQRIILPLQPILQHLACPGCPFFQSLNMEPYFLIRKVQ